MATTRATGFVITAAMWNAIMAYLTDDGATFSGTCTGAFNGTTVAASSTLKERGRSTPLGEWSDHAYNASDYLCEGGDWTVASGDLLVNRYSLVGKTMLWTVQIASSSVNVTPNFLRITVPAGALIATTTFGAVAYASDNSTSRAAFVEAIAGNNFVDIRRQDLGTWAVSTNLTSIYFQMLLEIQ